MTVGTDYSTPVIVNGFHCKNCTDVDYARKHIDPAHPKSGPYGINAKDDPTVKQSDTTSSTTRTSVGSAAVSKPAPGVGTQLDISA